MLLTLASTVRRASVEDLPQIVAMGMRFAGTEYAELLPADPACIEALAQRILESAESALFVAEPEPGRLTGMIAMMTYEHPMSGEQIATEIAWWMTPEARGSRDALRLLAAGKAWGRDRGATKLQMIAPTDRVAAFYERLGFRRTEIHYQGDL